IGATHLSSLPNGRVPTGAERCKLRAQQEVEAGMQRIFKCTNMVLILLCAMYFVTYIMRQNITVAGSAIQQEFGFTNTQLGLIFSAYAYPYLLFQIIGGWLGDRFGARTTLFVSGIVWAGATMMTSLAAGLVSLFMIRVLMGFGVGATLPTATRA